MEQNVKGEENRIKRLLLSMKNDEDFIISIPFGKEKTDDLDCNVHSVINTEKGIKNYVKENINGREEI